MAYTTSKYSSEFAKDLLANLNTVLERDVNNAIDEVTSSTEQHIEDYYTPTRALVRFPSLYAEVLRSQVEQSEDDSYLVESHEFIITVAVTAKTWAECQTRLLNYVIAIDRVLRTMSDVDIAGAVAADQAKPAWEVVEHLYGSVQNQDLIYRKDALLRLVVRIIRR